VTELRARFGHVLGTPAATVRLVDLTSSSFGQKVLEEAIITFGSVAIVETAIAIKNRNQGNLRFVNLRGRQTNAATVCRVNGLGR
jgi:hypothetical protein